VLLEGRSTHCFDQPFARPLEVTIAIRRITTLACALCLAVPVAAGASPIKDPATVGSGNTNTQTTGAQPTIAAKGPYGVTLAREPQNTIAAKGPYGVTAARSPQNTIEANGPYGVTPVRGPQNTIEAKGPYGVTVANDRLVATGAKTQEARASGGTDASNWRAAAITEAALLALALGSALLVLGRGRVLRMGA
jgi:hypothetical protein